MLRKNARPFADLRPELARSSAGGCLRAALGPPTVGAHPLNKGQRQADTSPTADVWCQLWPGCQLLQPWDMHYDAKQCAQRRDQKIIING